MAHSEQIIDHWHVGMIIECNLIDSNSFTITTTQGQFILTNLGSDLHEARLKIEKLSGLCLLKGYDNSEKVEHSLVHFKQNYYSLQNTI